ncbi:DsbC family protein [Neptunomonas japonica]|uniref:Thiol:disulfide interchange protein n=1 Tax=Neptunomonas japonica JAMM 1380 TaxID=1441457 RepID=A0A7R6SUK2_9GAMM|nr:DsbC family protein [Neptunomonas japonica]BBB28441.1 thiol:disulfide interchange protein DsbC [Neptunomonas japonica JAMM 1380]
MRIKTLIAGVLLLASTMVVAEDAKDVIIKQLQKIDQRIPVVSVKEAQLAGMYEVELGTGEVIFSDAKGEYFLLGQLYQLSDEKGFVNLSEAKMNTQRAAQLQAIPSAEKVVFKAKGVEKASVYVFTDVDCPYCRKLHNEVPKLQAMGVSVEYLAFPRQGPNTATFKKMTNIWCAEDKVEAMTRSKQGKSLKNMECENPVLAQYEVGQKVGVTGTPAIITKDGQLIPGYMPAERLAAMLGIKP